MNRQLVRGRLVVTRWGADGATVESGAIYIEDGIVRETGRFGALQRRHPDAEPIGDGTHVVMPGFVNAHSHGRGITTLRQGIPDEPGEVRSVGLRLGLSVDPYWDVLLTCARQLEGGITTTVHLDSNYGFGPPEAYEMRLREVISAYSDSGIRFSVTLALRDPNIDDPYLDETFLAGVATEIRREIEGWRKPPIPLGRYLRLYETLCGDFRGTSLQFEPVGVDSCSDEFLALVRKEATVRGVRIQVHLLETPYQKAHSLERFGKTSVSRLEGLGFLGGDVSCAHCVWLTERDIDILRSTGAGVVHNPSSNLRLRNGLAPIRVMAAAGIPIALGIDNLGINDDEDMLQEVRLAQLQQSAPGIGRPAIPAETALQWATEGGARTVGARGLGRLEAGSPADLIMVDPRPIEASVFGHGQDVAASVVQWVRQRNIDQVMVGGRILVRGGRYVFRDRDEVERKAVESGRQWLLTPAVRLIRAKIVESFANQQVAGEPYYRLHSRI
jgi:cytosine/adenosine deaminase-related metal-dependent hydrolase